MTINYSDLKQWSITAAVVLQSIVDDAQAATGEPFGDSECTDLRNLLVQHERIMSGVELWQKQLADCAAYDTGAKLKLDV